MLVKHRQNQKKKGEQHELVTKFRSWIHRFSRCTQDLGIYHCYVLSSYCDNNLYRNNGHCRRSWTYPAFLETYTVISKGKTHIIRRS